MLACSFVFLPCVLQQLLRFLQLKRMICRSISWPLEVARPQDLAVIRYKGKTVNRATSRVEVSVEPNSMSRSNTAFSLEADEFVTISCTYSPKTSDVDFGLITPRNTFLYLSGADGHFYETIQGSESGLYYFAIRNNTDRAIEGLGYVYF